MSQMKVLSKAYPQQGIWQSQAEVPAYGPHDVLIKVKKASICGTDLHIYQWDQWARDNIPVPITLGHEYMGEVAAVGDEVQSLTPGDIVSGEGHITCGYCRNCRAGRRHLCRHTFGVGIHRPGAFAEYLALPAFNAFKPPHPVPEDLLAIFDPFGNAVHMALSFDVAGEDVLITGAGPIGIMAAAVCRHVGARHIVITDVNDYRLRLAEQFDISEAVNVSGRADSETASQQLQGVMDRLGMTEGFDIGLEVSGHHQAVNSMMATMNRGGRLACLGLAGRPMNIDWDLFVLHGLHLKGIYGREMFETWYKMSSLLDSGLDISPVITHRFDIDDYQQAFDTMLDGRCGKVILNW